MRCTGHDLNCNCNGSCLKMRQHKSLLERVVDDFESYAGVKLRWRQDSETDTVETPIAWNGLTDTITYDTKEITSSFAVVEGFSFVVEGATVSANFPKPIQYASVDEDANEIHEADDAALWAAIVARCGPINYGDCCLE